MANDEKDHARDHMHDQMHDHARDGTQGHAPDHDHVHGHVHGQGHGHAPRDFGKAFLVGIILNTAFVAIEAAYGFLSGSMALIADAGHNLTDVLGLLIAWSASLAARRPPTARFTYGLRKTSILSALVNGFLTLLAAGAIAVEAVQRLFSPEPVAAATIVVVAAIGTAINGFTAWLFMGGREADLNVRGAYLHMAADAAVSLGVVVSGLAIMATGWNWLDPAVSLAIVAVIIASAWGLIRESAAMSFAAVPTSIDPARVRAFLAARPGVASLHDLHIWPISTTETALTAHLVMPSGHPGDTFLLDTARELLDHFQIGHATLQIELAPRAGCALEPDNVI